MTRFLLAFTLLAIGCDAGYGHRPGVPRQQLQQTWENLGEMLPVHGIVSQVWYMDGDNRVVVDFDSHVLHETGKPRGGLSIDRTFVVSADKVDELRKLGIAAWNEVQHGEMPYWTDISERLYVLDGDEGFALTGWPVTAATENDSRPNAGRAAVAVWDLVDDEHSGN